MWKAAAIGLLIYSQCLVAGQARVEYPSVTFTRYLAYGGTEGYRVTCKADSTGSDKFICRLARTRNGQSMDNRWIYARTLTPLLTAFFSRLHGHSLYDASEPPSDVVLTWDVRLGKQRARGFSRTDLTYVDKKALDSILALEVSFAEPFFELNANR